MFPKEFLHVFPSDNSILWLKRWWGVRQAKGSQPRICRAPTGVHQSTGYLLSLFYFCFSITINVLCSVLSVASFCPSLFCFISLSSRASSRWPQGCCFGQYCLVLCHDPVWSRDFVSRVVVVKWWWCVSEPCRVTMFFPLFRTSNLSCACNMCCRRALHLFQHLVEPWATMSCAKGPKISCVMVQI